MFKLLKILFEYLSFGHSHTWTKWKNINSESSVWNKQIRYCVKCGEMDKRVL